MTGTVYTIQCIQCSSVYSAVCKRITGKGDLERHRAVDLIKVMTRSNMKLQKIENRALLIPPPSGIFDPRYQVRDYCILSRLSGPGPWLWNNFSNMGCFFALNY